MGDIEHRYVIYGLNDPHPTRSNSEDEVTISSLRHPLFTMDKSVFPSCMSFAAIGSRVFMVGGSESNGNGGVCSSRKVFIYDSESSSMLVGPILNSGKYHPVLMTLGSKLFALSHKIYSYDYAQMDETFDQRPRFEMLDTDQIESNWSVLIVPKLRVTVTESFYSVYAYAAVFLDGGSRGVIFVSVSDAGTYAYEVENNKWKHVSDYQLPFYGHAVSMPQDTSLCCGYSFKSEKFCAFRFSYVIGKGHRGFSINEIEIDISYLQSPLLPSLQPRRKLVTVCGPNGRMYIVFSGAEENAPMIDPVELECYVKIYAFSDTKLELNKASWLKRCEKKQKIRLKRGEDEAEPNMEASWLKWCEKKQKIRRERGEEEPKMEMTGLWKKSLHGGIGRHLAAAFAM